MIVSQHMHNVAGRFSPTDVRAPLKLDGSVLLTLATILLYGATIGFLIYAAMTEPGGGIFTDMTYLGR